MSLSLVPDLPCFMLVPLSVSSTAGIQAGSGVQVRPCQNLPIASHHPKKGPYGGFSEHRRCSPIPACLPPSLLMLPGFQLLLWHHGRPTPASAPALPSAWKTLSADAHLVALLLPSYLCSVVTLLVTPSWSPLSNIAPSPC